MKITKSIDRSKISLYYIKKIDRSYMS